MYKRQVSSHAIHVVVGVTTVYDLIEALANVTRWAVLKFSYPPFHSKTVNRMVLLAMLIFEVAWVLSLIHISPVDIRMGWG